MPFIYTKAFAEDQHQSISAEDLFTGVKGFIVGIEILNTFAYAVDRQDLYRREETGQEFIPEYISTGERPDGLLKEAVEQHSIKKGVGVVGGDQYRALLLKQFRSVHPDRTEKKRAKQPYQDLQK